MKISRNLSVTDATESLKQQIAALKRYLFTKLTQACAYNEVKDNLKQNDRSASVSRLQNVFHFIRERHTHLPLKLNIIVWSNGCAAQFRFRYVFFLLSKSVD